MSAITIYQEFLDEVSDALLAHDADRFLQRVFRPHLIVTETEEILVETDTDARRQFEGFANALASQGVDAYIRSAREAWFVDASTLLGRHESYIMSGSKLIVPRFSNETRLVLRAGVWGSTETRHHARYVAWPDILPRPS